MIVAWRAAHRSVSGHQGRYEMREIVNSLLYQSRTGRQWDLLPHGLPPGGAVMNRLRQVARRRHRPEHPRPAAPAGTGEGATESGPEPSGARHPEHACGGRGARGVDGV
ncbi:transposase [Streptomyces griseorubiginosus]